MTLDKLMIAWGIWAIFSSFFHKDPAGTLVGQLGLVYDGWGLYFLLRIFIEDMESLWILGRIVIIILIPIAVEMAMETLSGRNSFSIFGGVGALCEIRGGKIRAQGPFSHSILAGTVGGICLPLALVMWRKNRALSIVGLLTTTCIVICSRSSGPIMTCFFGVLGLSLWFAREKMRLIRWAGLLVILLLNLVMNTPVYYLLAKIDLTGNSTGFHRAALIDAAIRHFSDWWFAGTDYTRDWMPTGVPWSKDHTDITNYYIKMGVLGGFPLMVLFISQLVAGFVAVGKALRQNEEESLDKRLLIWTLGAILFAHAATMISVSYFDQSVVFLYLVLAAIGSIPAQTPAEEVVPETEVVLEPELNEQDLGHHC